MNSKSIFSINMIRARKMKSWTQDEAAGKIGIKQKTLASYEEGRAQPPQSVLVNICRTYEVYDLYAFLTDRSYLATEKNFQFS